MKCRRCLRQPGAVYGPLNPGDVVTTVTPQGVGFKLDPPRLLTPSDLVEVEIDRIEAAANPIVGTHG